MLSVSAQTSLASTWITAALSANIRDAAHSSRCWHRVFINSAGKLGTTSGSSRRFKKEIKPMDKASEAILALKPVTFHYKSN